MARSTASTPASAAASTEAAAMPEVSWVWKWTGRPVSCFKVLISRRAASGFTRPAMSFRPKTWVPAAFSSRAILT